MSETMLLRKRLEELQATCGGWIPWREFMRFALYDPTYGYYTRQISGLGASGDFTTTPIISDLLAAGLVKWQARLHKREPKEWKNAPWIEVGAGNGALAAAWIKAHRKRTPAWMRWLPGGTTPYWIVEVSPVLRAAQKKAVGRAPVRWFASVAEALRAAGGRAVVFSNEFVDALPCSSWELQAPGWRERGIQLEGGKIFPVTRATPLPKSSIWQAASWASGQCVETHEAWRDWLAEWQPEARQVRLLTIDYGREAKNLYSRRPEGSLRAYWRHQRLEGSAIFARVGRQDLTADVNLTDLCTWAEELGATTESTYTLAEFLTLHARATPRNQAEQRLFDPDDAGGSFFVLEQKFTRAQPEPGRH